MKTLTLVTLALLMITGLCCEKAISQSLPVAQSAPKPAITPASATKAVVAPTVTSSPLTASASGTDSTTNQAPVSCTITEPEAESILTIPSTQITVVAAIGTTIQLKVNGLPVDPKQIGRTATDATEGTQELTWYGIILQGGLNAISARSVMDGVPSDWQTIHVYVPRNIQQIRLTASSQEIVADGRSVVTIHGETMDSDGRLVARDTVVTLKTDAGSFVGTSVNPHAIGFQVIAKGGVFNVDLKAARDAKIAHVVVTAVDQTAEIDIQMLTQLSRSLATGLINLVIGNRSNSFVGGRPDFLPYGRDLGDGVSTTVSGFVTGRLGNWLLTSAYDNAHPITVNPNGTTGYNLDTQGIDQTYPTYGDTSTRIHQADSNDNFYMRLEHNQDYAMWGNYGLNEFATRSQEYTSFSRQFHAFKSNYNFGRNQLTTFYGDNIHGYQRDSILPDGTSGYYYLSRRRLIVGSETVSFELEDILHPGTVVSSLTLQSGHDYTIDYDRGTLLFDSAVLKTEIGANGETLVRHIIATYEYDAPGSGAKSFGGRLQSSFGKASNGISNVGLTYVTLDQGSRSFHLYGADSWLTLPGDRHLVAEIAHSESDSVEAGWVKGDAYKFELDQSEKIGDIKTFYESAQPGFSNDTTITFTPGKTRYGSELITPVAASTSLHLQYDNETDSTAKTTGSTSSSTGGISDKVQTITVGVLKLFAHSNLTVNLVNTLQQNYAALATSGANTTQVDTRYAAQISKKTTLMAENASSISSHSDADHTSVSADTAVGGGVGLRVGEQYYPHGQYAGKAITSIDLVDQTKIDRDFTVRSKASLYYGLDGLSSQTSLGIDRAMQFSRYLKATASYEHILGDFIGRKPSSLTYPTATGAAGSVPSAGLSGGDSESFGLDYAVPGGIKASGKVETRKSSGSTNTVITADLSGKLNHATTGLLHYDSEDSSNTSTSGLGPSVTLRAGLAVRDPNSEVWNTLFRYEYRRNVSTIPETILLGSGTGASTSTISGETIFKPSWRTEIYGKYAMRQSVANLASDFAGHGLISLTQARILYRLGYRTDCVLEARAISQPTAGYSSNAYSMEYGYYITSDMRVALAYTVGKLTDTDFNGAHYSRGLTVNITSKVNELFNGFGRQNDLDRPILVAKYAALAGPLYTGGHLSTTGYKKFVPTTPFDTSRYAALAGPLDGSLHQPYVQ